MTRSRKESSTTTARSKVQPKLEALPVWDENPTEVNSNLPNTSVSSSTAPTLQRKVLCGECCQELDIRNPKAPTHKHNGTSICRSKTAPMANGPELVPDTVMLERQAFNERHRAILDAHDPLDRNNWSYKPASDGNKAIRTYLPLKGLK